MYFVAESEVKSQIRNFEIAFCNLQADTQEELISRNKTVESISARLRGLPPRIYRDYYKYLNKLRCSSKPKPRTLQELFEDLNRYCWNCFHYELLEFVIKANNCSKSLENRIDDYVREVKMFKRRSTISMFMKYSRDFFIGKSTPQGYNESKLRTKHNINPDEETIASLDRLPEDIWRSDAKLSECVMQLCNIAKGCIEIEWIVPEEFDYDLMTFICSEVGRDLLEVHEITKIFINDQLIDYSVYYYRSMP